jgi:NAD(P)-dependent dehydrogenase (short-subunit alcohol dehydrogenase family)
MRQATRRAPLAFHIEPAHPPRRLAGKVVLVALGEGGIGRAVALAFAREGADLAIVYFNDHRAAEDVRQLVLQEDVRCILLSGNATNEAFCRYAVRKVLSALGRLDILVNDAGKHCPHDGRRKDISKAEIEDAFRANLLSMFYLTKAAAPRLADGGAIINTAPAGLAARGPLAESAAATKRATVAFTRSLARALRDRHIRVNAVDPDADGIADGDVEEIAPSYVSLAMRDAGIGTGRVFRPAAERHAH